MQVGSLPLSAPTRLNELSDLDRFSTGLDNLHYVKDMDLLTCFYDCESNEKLQYVLSRNMLNTKGTQ